MFFLQFDVTPSSTHPEKDRLGGGIVNCWIERSSLDEAIEVARRMIRESHFIVDEPSQTNETSRDRLNPDAIQYYEQALIDQEVIVIYTYPANESEE